MVGGGGGYSISSLRLLRGLDGVVARVCVWLIITASRVVNWTVMRSDLNDCPTMIWMGELTPYSFELVTFRTRIHKNTCTIDASRPLTLRM